MSSSPDRDAHYRPIIAGLILLGHFAHGLNFVVVAPILPLITADYGISHTSGGLLIGVVMLIQGAFGLLGGLVVGKLGLKRVYTVGWFMTGAGTLVFLSPDFFGLLGLRVVYGIGTALLVPATGPLIMQWFRPKQMPVMTSVSLAIMTVGVVVSVTTVAPLSNAIGWQNVLGIFGAVSLSGAVVWTFLGRSRDEGAVPLPALREIGTVLRSRAMVLLGLADAACFAQYTALVGLLPTFFHEERDMSLSEAGFVIGLMPFMGMVGVLFGGFLTLMVPSRRMFLLVSGLMIGLGGFGSFLVDNTVVIYLSVALVGVGSWLFLPTLFSYPADLPAMTPARMGVFWGWVMTISGVANFIAPLMVGTLRDVTDSFTIGFLVFASTSWFLFVAGLLLPGDSSTRAKTSLPEI